MDGASRHGKDDVSFKATMPTVELPVFTGFSVASFLVGIFMGCVSLDISSRIAVKDIVN
jgi:hypothetical protein